MVSTVKVFRQVVKARDIQYFFGKQERQSFKMMAEMRMHFNKEKHQPITVTEFCAYYKINPIELSDSMNETDNFKEAISLKRRKKLPVEIRKTNPSHSIEIDALEKNKPYQFSQRIL
jgi:hypothetical protein